MVGRRFRDTLCHYTDKHSGRATSASVPTSSVQLR